MARVGASPVVNLTIEPPGTAPLHGNREGRSARNTDQNAFYATRATASDAVAIADVHSASFRLLTFLPMLHTIDEYRCFIANVILKECEVTVAEDETWMVAFLARREEEIRLLYTRPDRIGMGAGTQLSRQQRPAAQCTRTVVLPGKSARKTLLRDTELPCNPIYRWCEQRERTLDVRYRWER
jgi:hypothetical protein